VHEANNNTPNQHQILETQSATLTNYEVLVHLRKVQKRYADHPDFEPKIVQNWKNEKVKVDGRLRNLRLVVTDVSVRCVVLGLILLLLGALDRLLLHGWLTVYQLLRYLEADESPLASPHATYSPAVFRTLIQRLDKFNLTKTELIMIFNIRPKGKFSPLSRSSTLLLHSRCPVEIYLSSIFTTRCHAQACQ